MFEATFKEDSDNQQKPLQKYVPTFLAIISKFFF